MSKLVFIYITNPSKAKAVEISKLLLEKRLVGCANIFPITSTCLWEGKIARAREFALVAKTLERNFEKVKRAVEKVHPYEVPCILKIPASANKKFFEWLKREVG